MVRWLDGCMVRWLNGYRVCWFLFFSSWFISKLNNCMVRWLNGCMATWLKGLPGDKKLYHAAEPRFFVFLTLECAGTIQGL